jgi:hypothetical protein
MKTKTVRYVIGFSLVGMVALLTPGKAAHAGVDVHIGVGVPVLPAVVIPAPPAVVMIPNMPVYYAPDVGMDLFFYSGSWYRRHDDHWFRASYYNGPWAYTQPSHVPAVFMHMPAHYNRIPPGHARIPHGQLRKHWHREQSRHHRDFDD